MRCASTVPVAFTEGLTDSLSARGPGQTRKLSSANRVRVSPTSKDPPAAWAFLLLGGNMS